LKQIECYRTRKVIIRPSALLVYDNILSNFSSDEAEIFQEIKKLITNLSQVELLLLTYVTFPESRIESVRTDDLLRNRERISIDMYVKGKISICKAAELAGMSLQDLTEYLASNGLLELPRTVYPHRLRQRNAIWQRHGNKSNPLVSTYLRSNEEQ